MNTLHILIIVESIILIVLCCVLMYLIFGKGQAISTEFVLARDNKFKHFDKRELLDNLNDDYDYELRQATKFKPRKKTETSRSGDNFMREIGAKDGVAFNNFVKVFETPPPSKFDNNPASIVYTQTLHNHVRTPDTLFGNTLPTGATHYHSLRQEKPAFNINTVPRRSVGFSSTSSPINHITGIEMNASL